MPPPSTKPSKPRAPSHTSSQDFPGTPGTLRSATFETGPPYPISNPNDARAWLESRGWTPSEDEYSLSKLANILLATSTFILPQDTSATIRAVAYLLEDDAAKSIASNLTNLISSKVISALENLTTNLTNTGSFLEATSSQQATSTIDLNDTSTKLSTISSQFEDLSLKLSNTKTSIDAATTLQVSSISSFNDTLSKLANISSQLDSTTIKITNHPPPTPQPTWASIASQPPAPPPPHLAIPQTGSPSPLNDRLHQRLLLASRSILISTDPADPSSPKDPNQDSLHSLRDEINKRLSSADETENAFIAPNEPKRNTRVRGIAPLKGNSFILELNSPHAASHFKDYCATSPNTILSPTLGNSSIIKHRRYNLIVKFVPCNGIFDPTDPSHISFFESDNNLNPDSILSAGWIKHPDRRAPRQTVASLRIACANPQIANYLIKERVYIANHLVKVYKDLVEPMRCNKCQQYGHLRASCPNVERCASCASPDHTTLKCHPKNPPTCITCGPNSTHPSSHRSCPSFAAKCIDTDTRHPENALPYFPTNESWTWVPNPPKLSLTKPTHIPPRQPSPPRSSHTPPPSSQPRLNIPTSSRPRSAQGHHGTQRPYQSSLPSYFSRSRSHSQSYQRSHVDTYIP